MILLLCPAEASVAGAVVLAGLRRSFGHHQVEACSLARWTVPPPGVAERLLVAVQPREEWGGALLAALGSTAAKVVVFGRLPSAVQNAMGVATAEVPPELGEAAQCEAAPPGAYRESPLCVVYRRWPVAGEPPIAERAFLRYDFADEWNNLGFGAVRVDASIWALNALAEVPQESCVADVTLAGETVSAYAALWDEDRSSLLWVNRAVGPVDSQEWRLVELFFCAHRHGELSAVPVLSEIPYGYDACVTMRLDCDEDVESARALAGHYDEWGVPFSLAVHTALLQDPVHHSLVREVAGAGGAILSHSATHAAEWGGSYESAFNEAQASAAAIRAVIGDGAEVHYAVSPFHQTPPYALDALADAGYRGCVGGIIRNDPEALMARGGPPPGSPFGLVSHSQQCMLHGDCLSADADSIKVFRTAFDMARRGRSLFGYLDHPFSERYQYGWASEATRTDAHREFLAYIREQGRVLFLSEDAALDFIWHKTSWDLRQVPRGQPGSLRLTGASEALKVAVEYAGEVLPLSEAEQFA